MELETVRETERHREIEMELETVRESERNRA